MTLVISGNGSMPLPTRAVAPHKSLNWPVCGRVVDVSGGPGGHALRCHLAHGHRGSCDDLGSAELEHWQALAAKPAPTRPAPPPSLDVIAVALAHARTYSAMAHWKRERGWQIEAERLDAMADSLRRLVQVLER
jgi:hypothetical protein